MGRPYGRELIQALVEIEIEGYRPYKIAELAEKLKCAVTYLMGVRRQYAGIIEAMSGQPIYIHKKDNQKRERTIKINSHMKWEILTDFYIKGMLINEIAEKYKILPGAVMPVINLASTVSRRLAVDLYLETNNKSLHETLIAQNIKVS